MTDTTIAGLARAGGVGVETVRYYQRRGLMPKPDGAGGVLLAGQDRFEDKGVGLPLRLTFGESPDVRVQTRLVKSGSSTRGAVTTERTAPKMAVTTAR